LIAIFIDANCLAELPKDERLLIQRAVGPATGEVNDKVSWKTAPRVGVVRCAFCRSTAVAMMLATPIWA